MRYKDRIKKLKAALTSQKLDGFLIVKRENILYLTGLDSENSSLLITVKEKSVLITDARFAGLARNLLRNLTITPIDSYNHKPLEEYLKKNKIMALGFESAWLAHKNYIRLKKSLKWSNLVPKLGLIENLRAVKDSSEIACIKKSAAIVKEVHTYVKKMVSPGMTTAAVAALIDSSIISRGSQRAAFQAIVARDPYSAYPHGPADSYIIRKNSALLIDMGAVYKGYNSDLTRVLFLGKITPKFESIYNIIKAAQNKAIDEVRPGAKASDIDRAARRYISDKGLGKYFLHSLGHGVGLEIHESPVISKKNGGVLTAGMVFTVEPGVYIPGWGGIRLEDMVLVTNRGCEVLTNDIPK